MKAAVFFLALLTVAVSSVHAGCNCPKPPMPPEKAFCKCGCPKPPELTL